MLQHFKGSLLAHENIKWTETVPIVLLGLHIHIKDLNATSSQLVYGTTLRLPSDLLSDDSTVNPTVTPTYVTNLFSIMKKLNPRNPILHGNSKFFVSPSLTSCSHIFLRNDLVRPPLTPPYSGPHLVKSRTDKNFVININGKNLIVTTDRCKPAFEISETPPKVALPNGNLLQNNNSKNLKITRYGRVVHFPKRLSEEI
ncbi:uncharacterized protein LOC129968410 [Argiope bruennichi]|uniref:uncharacterized protein LOC129968410 n=1 Tax=Argiope bruennichi TaxID=94029 RepID=UPI002495960F|nr:uncharacterized protein LOC129968410 [Argiope bruennichi]